MPKSTCVAADRLGQFVRGVLAEFDAQSIEKHLAECEACLELALSLDAADWPSPATAQPLSPAHPEVDLDNLKRKIKALTEGSSIARRPAGADSVNDTQNSTTLRSGNGSRPAHGAEVDALPTVPDYLGQYRILKLLGAGGMGVVFLAEDLQLKRKVALKAMKPSVAVDESYRKRFQREAQMVAGLTHDHIVTIHHVGEDRGVPFLVMPFLQGETLEDRLGRERRLALDEILRISREIAEGLAAAHTQGMIHRDIKPGNIWLESPSGRVKILDFGLAREQQSSNPNSTSAGVILGTPAYMSPEQARMETMDGRTDLFSLGCVMYRACTGQMPFAGKDTFSVLLAVTHQRPRPPAELDAALPGALSDLIMQLLEKDPARRIGSAAEVVLALKNLQQEAKGSLT